MSDKITPHLTDKTLLAIAEDLHKINACLHVLEPVSFCGCYVDKETCVDCYFTALKAKQK